MNNKQFKTLCIATLMPLAATRMRQLEAEPNPRYYARLALYAEDMMAAAELQAIEIIKEDLQKATGVTR